MLIVNSNKTNAWNNVCGETYDELCKLNESKEIDACDKWLVAINNADTSIQLVLDIKEMTKKIPFKGSVVDMTHDLKQWLAADNKTQCLVPLFS